MAPVAGARAHHDPAAAAARRRVRLIPVGSPVCFRVLAFRFFLFDRLHENPIAYGSNLECHILFSFVCFELTLRLTALARGKIEKRVIAQMTQREVLTF